MRPRPASARRRGRAGVGPGGRLAAAAAFAVTLIHGGPAAAHAFGQRYDLPVPLALYLAGGGATVALTLVLFSAFVREGKVAHGYARFDLLATRPGRALAHPWSVSAAKIASVAVFLLVIVAGFIGSQSPIKNIAPTMVWVIWWVGMAFVSALVGNLWALINPWSALYGWAEALFMRCAPGRRLGLGWRYPARLGPWPAVVLFFLFAWSELVWDGSETPVNVAWVAVAYSVMTWIGMFVFGRRVWLREAEVSSIAFGLLARFAPMELRVDGGGTCAVCDAAACRDRLAEDCVDCHECYARAKEDQRSWNLRPWAVGLISRRAVHPAMTVFAVMLLATVSFDGFVETPAWQAILDWVVTDMTIRPLLLDLRGAGVDLLAAVKTVGLLLAPILFLAAYLGFCALMVWTARGTGASEGDHPGVGAVARHFVLSLVPIAIAYHLAHYLSFLLLAGQLVIPLASDPFGFGWNLFGTAAYAIDVGVVNARMVWFVAVTTVVVGHVLAVYIAHVVALAVYGDARRALRSQYPMLVLMVGYTMTSLWILAQPVVKSG